MNLSKIYPILKDYLHSPFFYCFIFLLITEIGIEQQTIYDIREAFWSTQIWISILVTAISIDFFIKIPAKALSESRPHVKERTPLLQRSLMGGTLAVILITHVVFFELGLFITLGINHPETINNKSQFDTTYREVIAMEAIIPLVHYFCYKPTKNVIKKQLSLGNFYDKNKEIAFAFPFVWMVFITSLIVVVSMIK